MFSIETLLESGPRIERCTPSEYDSTDQQKAAENDKGENTLHPFQLSQLKLQKVSVAETIWVPPLPPVLKVPFPLRPGDSRRSPQFSSTADSSESMMRSLKALAPIVEPVTASSSLE